MASTVTETVFMPIGVAANWTEPLSVGELVSAMFWNGVVGTETIVPAGQPPQDTVMPIGVAANWTAPSTSGEMFNPQ